MVWELTMVIGIDASRAIKENKTGVEWYAYHVITQIIALAAEQNNSGANSGADVSFVLYCDREPDAWLQDLATKPNVSIRQLRWPLKYLWTQGRLSWEMFRRPPDVLFIPASAIPLIHPKRTMTTIHDVGFMAFPQGYTRLKKYYLRWSARHAVKHAKKIITISEFSKDEIVKYFATPPNPPLVRGGTRRYHAKHETIKNKIVVTPLGYDEKYFNVGDVRAVLQRYNITRPYFLFVGRLETKKNIAGLVRAFAEFKQQTPPKPPLRKGRDATIGTSGTVKLVLAGTAGYGWQEAQKIIQDNALQSDITITGYVAAQDLPDLYRGALALVFPSYYEGFGLPVLEAFACGTPVICADGTALPEVAGDAAIMVKADDYHTLAQKMAQLAIPPAGPSANPSADLPAGEAGEAGEAGNETLRRSLAYQGIKRASLFSWKQCGRQTWEVMNFEISGK